MARTLKRSQVEREAEVFAHVDFAKMEAPMPPTLHVESEADEVRLWAGYNYGLPWPLLEPTSQSAPATGDESLHAASSRRELSAERGEASSSQLSVLSDDETAALESALLPSTPVVVVPPPSIGDVVPLTVPQASMRLVASPPARAARDVKSFGRFRSTDLVKVLVPNPKRLGSKAHRRFKLYRDGGTVGDYAVALGSEAWRVRADLNWDTDYGHVLVTRDGEPV